ncbi:ABC transporter [Methanocella sp. CWC-04]|uniref:ABC transporter n=1 Tax=Methanooceanicella nereidis TaxID=2052831 RepID=A0AAP2RC90_9EURY|nr:ABC transporter permease [Methanocella sp. CWC-04]MCD1294412.1 ABC transporter [Methanocella sp. CWC-04]
MKNILTLAKRETRRFRSRFTGRSRLIVLLILAISLALSYMVFQQGVTLSKDIYTIGVSPDGPEILDSRFNVIALDRPTGYQMLYDKTIDVFIDGDLVKSRYDGRSLYAAGALKQYFEKEEITRIKDQYDIDKAFPLRIEINYLSAPQGSQSGPGVSTPLPQASSTPYVPSSYPTLIPTATPGTGGSAILSPTGTPDSTDDAVKKQIEKLESGDMTNFKAEFVSDKEIIVPSLMNPPVPLAQVIIAFLYIVPIFFISIFFTSSFMEEKTNRKLNILISSPVTPLEIIIGKLLPYFLFSLALTIGITLFLNGDLLLALAIFIPIILFIFSIYLMVALIYRTYKDQTFFSMTAITFVTGYLVFPALFTGVNKLSYISPLTLAVEMYRGESFGIMEYLFSTGPMYLVFLLTMFLAVRMFNEEYLMSYGPLYRKIADAIYLAINKDHPYVSIAVLSALIIPAVFMVQLVFVALSVNLPPAYTLGILLLLCVIVEEIAKSAGIAMLIENRRAGSVKQVAFLSFFSALGFLAGEKLLLFLSLSVLSSVMLIDAMGSANLLIIPLIAHFVFTLIVSLTVFKFRIRSYPFAIIGGSLVHYLYNLYVLGMI